jgi:hypothetical protein
VISPDSTNPSRQGARVDHQPLTAEPPRAPPCCDRASLVLVNEITVVDEVAAAPAR